jgi:hypothetical protein
VAQRGVPALPVVAAATIMSALGTAYYGAVSRVAGGTASVRLP